MDRQLAILFQERGGVLSTAELKAAVLYYDKIQKLLARGELEKIRRQKLWQSDKQKQYYTEVTDTLREYIAERYGIATMERPSGEMLYDLRAQGVDAALYDEISDLFSRADLVKFAKYEATKEENEEAVPTAVRFVNSTYLQEIETN